MHLNPNLTWKLVEERLAEETNPTRKRNLELVLAHMKAEARADIEGVVATLCEKPRYRTYSTPEDNTLMNPEGSKDAVRGAAMLQATFPAPPMACARRLTFNTGIGASGDTLSTLP